VAESSESGGAPPQQHTDTELSTTATESHYHRSGESGAPAQNKRDPHDDQVHQQHYGSFYLRMGAVGAYLTVIRSGPSVTYVAARLTLNGFS
jgi:hypothetical protein